MAEPVRVRQLSYQEGQKLLRNHPGAVGVAYPALAGSVSDLAGTLHTEIGRIFCKAIQTAYPLVHMHRNKAPG